MISKTNFLKLPRFTTAAIALISLCFFGNTSKANAISLLNTQTDSFSGQLTDLSGTPLLTLGKFTPGTGYNVTSVVFKIRW